MSWTETETWRKGSCGFTTVTLLGLQALPPALFLEMDKDIFQQWNRQICSSAFMNTSALNRQPLSVSPWLSWAAGLLLSLQESSCSQIGKRTETEDSVFSVLPIEWVSAFAKIVLLDFRFLWLKGTSSLQNPWSKVVLLTWNSGYLQGHPCPLLMSLTDRQVILKTF